MQCELYMNMFTGYHCIHLAVLLCFIHRNSYIIVVELNLVCDLDKIYEKEKFPIFFLIGVSTNYIKMDRKFIGLNT